MKLLGYSCKQQQQTTSSMKHISTTPLVQIKPQDHKASWDKKRDWDVYAKITVEIVFSSTFPS